MPRLAAVGHAYGHGGTRERPTLLSRRSAARAAMANTVLSEALGEHTCTSGGGTSSGRLFLQCTDRRGGFQRTRTREAKMPEPRDLTPESAEGRGRVALLGDAVTVRVFPPFTRSVSSRRSARAHLSPSLSGRNALRTMRCVHASAGLTHRGAAHRHCHPAPAWRGERAGQPAHQGAGWP